MIEVRLYSGYKGEERPRALVINGKEHLITEIIRKEEIEDYKTRHRKTVFFCVAQSKLYKVTKDSFNNWTACEQK